MTKIRNHKRNECENKLKKETKENKDNISQINTFDPGYVGKPKGIFNCKFYGNVDYINLVCEGKLLQNYNKID